MNQNKLTRLSEPSEIVLEQILFGTNKQEQFAIVGRAAAALGCRLSGTTDDYGVQSDRFLREANRREVSPTALINILIGQVVANDLFGSILDPITPAQRNLLERV